MDRPMTDKERRLIPEIITLAMELPADVREKWLWMGEGMVFARSHKKNGESN